MNSTMRRVPIGSKREPKDREQHSHEGQKEQAGTLPRGRFQHHRSYTQGYRGVLGLRRELLEEMRRTGCLLHTQ